MNCKLVLVLFSLVATMLFVSVDAGWKLNGLECQKNVECLSGRCKDNWGGIKTGSCAAAQ